MEKFINWIDKNIEDILKDPVYQLYFQGVNMTKEEDDFYLSRLDKGIELVLSNEKNIISIHFFGEKDRNFIGDLPNRLKFSFNKAEIHEIFGLPYRIGDP